MHSGGNAQPHPAWRRNIPTRSDAAFSNYGTNNQNQTSCFLYRDITVARNSSLSFSNDSIFIGSPDLEITDYGSLSIKNSTIIPLCAVDSLCLHVSGLRDAAANFSLVDSRYCISGAMNFSNANVTIYSSTVSSAAQDPASPNSTLRSCMQNSTYIAYNSSVSGLMHSNSTSMVTISNAYYTGGGPFSSNSILPICFTRESGNQLITNLNVSMEFSGSNPTGLNSLNFSYDNKNYTYAFASTGSVFNKVHASFSLPVPLPYNNLSLLTASMSIRMYVANAAGSNSSLENLSLAIGSNDTYNLIGNQYFSYVVNTSSLYLINSSLNLDRNAIYSYQNLRNPEHDSLSMHNSVADFMNASLSGQAGNCRFFSIDNSKINLILFVKIEANSYGHQVSNYTFSLSAKDFINYTSTVNAEASMVMSRIPGHSERDANIRGILTCFISNDTSTHTNSYSVSIYSCTYNLSLPPYNFSRNSLLLKNYSIVLPVLGTTLCTLSSQMNCTDTVEYKNTMIYNRNITVNQTISFTDASETIGCVVKTNLSVSTNLSDLEHVSLFVPFIRAKCIEVKITTISKDPTSSGYVFNSTYNMSLYVNASLKVQYTYKWLSNDSKLGIAVHYSADSGPFNATTNATVTFYNDSGSFQRACSSYSASSYTQGNFFFFQFSATNFTEIDLSVVIGARGIVYRNSTASISFVPATNTSFYPISKVCFKEKGLPVGTLWSIDLGSQTYSSVETSFSQNVTNGIYTYSVCPVPGYIAANCSGKIFATHASEVLNIEFSPYKFRVIFTENGLPAGAAWNISVAGSVWNSTNISKEVLLPNGTYEVTADSSGYATANTSYCILINGASKTVKINFVQVTQVPAWKSFLDLILFSPITYIVVPLSVFGYYLYFYDSSRICSFCLKKIPRFSVRCDCRKKS